MSPDKRIIKSTCISCHRGCGVLVTVEDGRVVLIEGSPASQAGSPPVS